MMDTIIDTFLHEPIREVEVHKHDTYIGIILEFGDVRIVMFTDPLHAEANAKHFEYIANALRTGEGMTVLQ